MFAFSSSWRMSIFNSRPRRANTLCVLVLLAGLLGGLMFTSSASAAGCDKYASPTGSDRSGNGRISRPYETVAKLDASLAFGQTGCLRAGIYGSVSTVFELDNSGSPAGNIEIRAYPDERAKLIGLIRLEGSYTTISGLNIDGSNNRYVGPRPSGNGANCRLPVSSGMEIDGHGDIFQHNDFYQSVPNLRGTGIGIGWNHPADGTIIRYNRIHDLGQCQAFDQMIYLAHGNGVQIYDNWLWNDPHGWGVQVYPAASNAHIYNNVIDGAGSGFVISGDATVSGNVIDHNIVMNSTGLNNAGLRRGVGISDYWSSTPGPGNVFRRNDLYDNPGGVAEVSAVTVSANSTANPGLTDPRAHIYGVAPGSTLISWGLWSGGPRANLPLDRRANVRNRRRASVRGVRRRNRSAVRAHTGRRRRRNRSAVRAHTGHRRRPRHPVD